MGAVTSSFKSVVNAVKSAPPQAQQAAPSTAEVSQSGAASAMETETVKKRRRGKSPTILTGAAGVEEGATLGSPTLLG